MQLPRIAHKAYARTGHLRMAEQFFHLSRSNNSGLAEILHLARHDPLTGLCNRRPLRNRLEELLSRHTTDHAPPVGVMYVDLDGFKKVNDTLGHHAGDEFLVVLGNTTAIAGAALARRIIAQLSFPYLLSTGTTAKIGASVGIAFSNRNNSFDLLMKRADTAL